MKKLIISFIAILNLNLFASEFFNLTYFGNEGSTRIFLSCDYARFAVNELASKLNLENAQVDCFGGITPNWTSPVSIRLKFDLPNPIHHEIEIKSNFSTNCYFDTYFLNSFLREYRSYFNIIRKNNFCSRSDSRYYYLIEAK